MTEAQFQTKVIKWLRHKGCFTFKVQAGPGVPTGTPDIFFCKEGFYGFLEIKKSRNSKKQPLQDKRVDKLDEWSYAKFAYPENWDKIKKELSDIIA